MTIRSRTPLAHTGSPSKYIWLFAALRSFVSWRGAVLIFALAFWGSPAHAAPGGDAVDGAQLGLYWIAPFVGVLLSIAIFPLAAPHIWHAHYGKIAMAWAVLFIAPFTVQFGPSVALYEVLHAVLLEFIPFIIIIFTLFTIAGGIYIRGNLHGSPKTNTALLGVGMGLASFVGTTGASMIMIRPVLRANDDRRHNAHVFVFFIFLVSNVGGGLTPLGDPPLFIGFLKGVDFFWTVEAMLLPVLLMAVLLLAAFFALDTVIYRREGHDTRDPTPDSPIRVEGWRNVGLLALVVAAVLWSGMGYDLGAVSVAGVEVKGASLARDAMLLALAGISLAITPKRHREANGFEWGPCLEVAKLFLAIFITIIPAIAILKAGQAGELAGLLRLVTNEDGSPNNAVYFWMTGALSSFLDNAPTYLVFFNAAGGDAEALMGPLANTLLAISAGAVFMGANTYIGNAPNFMVKAIAEQAGVKMPSFFGYMLWSCVFLIPCFALITVLFF